VSVHCRICGRLLTAALSVDRGIGPVCWSRVQRSPEEVWEKIYLRQEDVRVMTPWLLQRHRGTINCRGCGQPINVGERVVKRRVNNRVRYFHSGCVYTQPYHTKEAEEEVDNAPVLERGLPALLKLAGRKPEEDSG